MVADTTSNSRRPPSIFICPLANKIMEEPVVHKLTGLRFEKKAIMEWIYKGHITCPVTDEPLHPNDLEDDQDLQDQVALWLMEQLEMAKSRHCEEEENVKRKDEGKGKRHFHKREGRYVERSKSLDLRSLRSSSTSSSMPFLPPASPKSGRKDKGPNLPLRSASSHGLSSSMDDLDEPVLAMVAHQKLKRMDMSKMRISRMKGDSGSVSPVQSPRTSPKPRQRKVPERNRSDKASIEAIRARVMNRNDELIQRNLEKTACV